MLITISGLPGSGKTTVARLVACELGLEHVYAGEIFRREPRFLKPVLWLFDHSYRMADFHRPRCTVAT
jgi:cytidylate kinase